MLSLDNVIWQALTTRQTGFAESFDQARRFQREVTSLGAFHQPTDRGYESLAGLLGTGETVALFLDKPYDPRPGWNLIADTPLLQMVCENGGAPIPFRSDSPPPSSNLPPPHPPKSVNFTPP